jgi:hypothetical protein
MALSISVPVSVSDAGADNATRPAMVSAACSALIWARSTACRRTRIMRGRVKETTTRDVMASASQAIFRRIHGRPGATNFTPTP